MGVGRSGGLWRVAPEPVPCDGVCGTGGSGAASVSACGDAVYFQAPNGTWCAAGLLGCIRGESSQMRLSARPPAARMHLPPIHLPLPALAAPPPRVKLEGLPGIKVIAGPTNETAYVINVRGRPARGALWGSGGGKGRGAGWQLAALPSTCAAPAQAAPQRHAKLLPVPLAPSPAGLR